MAAITQNTTAAAAGPSNSHQHSPLPPHHPHQHHHQHLQPPHSPPPPTSSFSVQSSAAFGFPTRPAPTTSSPVTFAASDQVNGMGSYFNLNHSLDGVYVVGKVGDPRAKAVRIVHISDTHGFHCDYLDDIPWGHVFIHSGDFGQYSFKKRFYKERERDRQLHRMNHFFSQLPHRYKIFVPGNEDFTLETLPPADIQKRLSNAIYLHDNACTLFGLKFYGSPWNVAPGGSLARGFARASSFIEKRWNGIPGDTDVLITHMAPWGNAKLYEDITKRLKPIVHLFGDPREGPGIMWKDHILFSNGAMHGRYASASGVHSSTNCSYSGGSKSTSHSFWRHKSSSLDRRYVNLYSDDSNRPRPIVIDVYVVADDWSSIDLPIYPPSEEHESQQRPHRGGSYRLSSITHMFSNGIKMRSHSGPPPLQPQNTVPSNESNVKDPLDKACQLDQHSAHSCRSEALLPSRESARCVLS